MILTDAGPLIALVDRGEPDHKACVACLADLTGPMLTTWPAFTEAMYLLGEAGGWYAQETLWNLLERSDLIIAAQGTEDYKRMRTLMHKYRDRPMDLADASLVCLAERQGVRKIFTLDKEDFRIYRLHGRQTFDICPAE
jgi:predicted nucleic acid-binding protein